jgi:hypothetical protein
MNQNQKGWRGHNYANRRFWCLVNANGGISEHPPSMFQICNHSIMRGFTIPISFIYAIVDPKLIPTTTQWVLCAGWTLDTLS